MILSMCLYAIWPEEKIPEDPELTETLISEDVENTAEEVEPEAETPVTFWGMFKNARFTMASLSSVLAFIVFCYFEPILGPELKKDYSLN